MSRCAGAAAAPGAPACLARVRWATTLALIALALIGCSTDQPKPSSLETLNPRISGRLVWQAKLDGARFGLSVAARAGRFHVAGDDGTVMALDADTGRVMWRAQAGARLSAGVGSDGRFAAVVTAGNELIAFDAGRLAWRQRLPGRVLTAPLVAGERVFVLGVDRAVQAFDALDGRRLWQFQRQGDALTLGQPGVLMAFGDTLVAGQGPRLTGIDPLRGTVRWEAALANPRGTNEIERLADLIGPAARTGNLVCARAFQAAVGCVDAVRATVAWSRNIGGTDPVAADASAVVAGDASDRLTAWRQGSGELLWTRETFLHRQLGGLTMAGPTVVFGDAQGFVHFLDRDSGQTLLRLATDGSRIAAVPVVWDTTVLVVTSAGGLYAFRPE